jgi:hypothetical protein
MRIVLVLAILGLIGTQARASKPIAWTMKGCVAGGVFYAIDKDSAARVNTMAGKSLDVSKLDGKYIEVVGLLYPGDYFTPGDKPPVVKRDCSADDRKAIEYAKAHDLRMQAARLPADKLDEAIKLVDASIALVQPADCDTFIDRAHLYAKKNDLAASARDIGILETRKCRFRGVLNWLLLQELGNELRTHNDGKTAVRALTLARANCDADICRPGIENDLAAAKAATTKK